MAIKYPENTSYSSIPTGQNSESISSTLRQMASKRLEQAKTASSKPYSVASTSPSTSGLSDEEKVTQRANVEPYINSGVPITPNFMPGTTIKDYEEALGSPYGTIKDPSETGYATKGNYLKPSEVTPEARFASLSNGGQYLIEPSKPGRAIQTERASLNWKENELIRQGLDPTLYQIDHVTPLWAGGSDTLANKEILDNFEHAKKTKMQSIPLTLLANGKISQREALSMATEWESKADTWDIRYPDPGDNGLVSLKDAERIAKLWNKTPKVSFKDFLKEFPTAGKDIYEGAARAVDTILPKSSATAVPREFIKGFTSGLPGYSLAMPQLDVYADYNDKGANTAGAVSHVLGAIAGNVITFSWAYKLAIKALAKSGVKWAAKTLGKEVKESAAKKLIREAGEKKLALTLGKKEITKEGIPKLLKGISKTNKYVKDVLPKAATLGAVSLGLGQLRPMHEEERAERAALDFAFGLFSPVGRAAYSVKGYAKVAAPALTI